MKKTKIRSLVVSGGGCKGAWGGGGIEYLHDQGIDWQTYYGTSTGSLLITLSSLGKMIKLKEAYTSISNDDIFSVDPFNKKGKIKLCNAICRLIKGETSLGETEKLRKIIEEMFTFEEFIEVKNQEKILHACITNYTLGKTEFKDNWENLYHDYLDYTWASTSVPIVTNLLRKNGYEYLDGGVMDHVPLQKAIDDGADEIDVVIHRPEKYEHDNWKAENMWEVLMRTIDLMEREVSLSDVLIGKLKAQDKNVKLNIYYTPYSLTDNSMVFDKKQMLKWWKEGYEYFKNHKPKCIKLESQLSKS